jgi:hypothetical protein
LLIVLSGVAGAWAQKPREAPRRYDIRADLENYPQTTARDTLASVIKAIDQKRIDYALAQLADPEFVDKRVRDYGGRFEEVVREAKAKLVDDPATSRQLKRYLRDGEWKDEETEASVGLKDGTERVFFRKIENRWYIENRKK